MTPDENFAQKRRDAESLIRQHAPTSSHAELIALLQPAIVLNATLATDAKIPLGASKFGGAPDVPDGFEWPMWNGKSHTFLAQINLAEVAPLDREKQLPPEGVLLFFVMLDEEGSLWEELEQRDGWRVVWAREPSRRQTPPADAHWVVAQNTQRVSFGAGWALDNMLVDQPWSESQWSDFYWGVLQQYPHRMLACPYAPQASPLSDAAYSSDRKNEVVFDAKAEDANWQLLLQLDTGAGDFFKDIHDVGWLYFMIRHDDLANGDFSKVWLSEQCT